MRAPQRVRGVRWFLLALLIGVLALNCVAWMQAWAMTHYAPAGVRTPKPEEMSFGEKIGAVLTGVTVPRPQNEHTPSDVGLLYETNTIPAGNEGETIEGWYVPGEVASAIVLMFTGYGESKESLLTEAAALHGLGYDLLLVDFRGAGGSTGATTTLGVREADDVAIATDYAQSEWPNRKIVLYGISMGAAAILRAMAVGGVQPDAVIIESPFDRLLSTVGNRFNAMGLPSFPASELLVFWGSVQLGFNGFSNNPADYARSVQCPALILHGEQDPRVTVEQSNTIYNALGGYKEHVEFAGAGHESLVATAPDLWEEKVGQFLSSELP
ncbi:MAG: alpha/beta hydrolase [Chloroflexota bacterium]